MRDSLRIKKKGGSLKIWISQNKIFINKSLKLKKREKTNQ